MRSTISETYTWLVAETFDGEQHFVLLNVESEFDRQMIEDELAMQICDDLAIPYEAYLVAQGRL